MRITPQPFGSLGEQADGGGEAPCEKVGHWRKRQNGQEIPEHHPLAPWIGPEAVLGAHYQPGAVGLLHPDLKGGYQEVVIPTSSLALDPVAKHAPHAPVREGRPVRGDDDRLRPHAHGLRQPLPDWLQGRGARGRRGRTPSALNLKGALVGRT